MKQYLSIPNVIRADLRIIAFDKLDGSNVRAEWSKKSGWYKFGSRTVLIDPKWDKRVLAEAPEIIEKKYGESLPEVFKKRNYDKVTCFFEYFGPNSFCGFHQDETHDVVLIDVNPYKKGILNPEDFIADYQPTGIPSILWRGYAGGTLQTLVYESKLEGMGFEGVVCKCKNPKKTPQPVMFKIKSKAWIDRLLAFCKGDDELFHKML